ncbi:hypothetical protein [Hymenobacter sp.]|jgi:hypothetical protein|uniref:hypothetical protein n=1 Tax=Hymenobacter sp. TaxID=1898978 RepID=UPI002EDAA8BD
MKYLLILIILEILLTGSNTRKSDTNKHVRHNDDCSNGQMTSANYQYGINSRIASKYKSTNDFSIVADTNSKADNFISNGEEYLLKRLSLVAGKTDATSLNNWTKLTTDQKIKNLNYLSTSERAYYTGILDKKGKYEVCIINNSKNIVTLQIQDGSYICVLQAVNKNDQWQPIQYWQLSGCGNSYYHKNIEPGSTSSFIARIPNKGNYTTRLRYKVLGKGKFYYSNIFTGKINYCEFNEPSISYRSKANHPRPLFKLDSLIQLAWN